MTNKKQKNHHVSLLDGSKKKFRSYLICGFGLHHMEISK